MDIATQLEDAAHAFARGDDASMDLITNAVRRIRELEQEEDFNYALQGRLGKILNDTANALKGPPDELALHSTHDLAKVSERVVTALRDLRREVRNLLKVHPGISQHSILSALEATSDALGETLDIPAPLRRGND